MVPKQKKVLFKGSEKEGRNEEGGREERVVIVMATSKQIQSETARALPSAHWSNTH